MAGKWIHSYGENPKGYFTYTKHRIVNWSISSEITLQITEVSICIREFTAGELLNMYIENWIATHVPARVQYKDILEPDYLVYYH